MQRFWTQRGIRWPEPTAAMLAERSCEATTWTPNDAFVDDRLTRAQAGTKTHFRVDHPEAGYVTFAVDRPIMGASASEYQQRLRERLDWASALLHGWSERLRQCPRNDPGGALRPKGRPEHAYFPVALYGSLKAALDGVPLRTHADLAHVRLILDRFVADRPHAFPSNTAIVLKHGPKGPAVELMDRRDAQAVEKAWEAFIAS